MAGQQTERVSVLSENPAGLWEEIGNGILSPGKGGTLRLKFYPKKGKENLKVDNILVIAGTKYCVERVCRPTHGALDVTLEKVS